MNTTIQTIHFDRDALCKALSNAGIEPGDVLIVHSSMKSLGYVQGGPQTVIAAMQDVLTPRGTLLMPTFSLPQPDDLFRVGQTPSRTGLITETLRTTPGVVRSWHPTHSVTLWGANAQEWSEGHHLIGGLGVGSPFHRAAQAGAKVLMIGCDMRTCSLVHVAEAVARVPQLGRIYYMSGHRVLDVLTPDGQRLSIPPIDQPACSAGFGIVQERLEAAGGIDHHTIGQAHCLLFDAQEALQTAVDLLRDDPAVMLCNYSKCTVCPRAREYLAELAVGG